MNKHILIIDDDENLATALSEILFYEGYDTTIATGGLAGLRQIRKLTPDIVVCDWEMPNLNGVAELLRTLRLSQDTIDIPFIILTGHHIEVFDFQPTAILAKPVSIYTLIDTIQRVTPAIN